MCKYTFWFRQTLLGLHRRLSMFKLHVSNRWRRKISRASCKPYSWTFLFSTHNTCATLASVCGRELQRVGGFTYEELKFGWSKFTTVSAQRPIVKADTHKKKKLTRKESLSWAHPPLCYVTYINCGNINSVVIETPHCRVFCPAAPKPKMFFSYWSHGCG